jgi:hypothetical protein
VSIGLCGSLPISPIPEGARGMRRNVCSDDRAELRQHGLPRTAHRRLSQTARTLAGISVLTLQLCFDTPLQAVGQTIVPLAPGRVGVFIKTKTPTRNSP